MKNNIIDMKRATIILSGVVQRVGLRSQIDYLSQFCEVKGYVKDLEDTVEIVCEGEQSQIDDLLDRIKKIKSPPIIKNIDVSYSDATGEFKGFRMIMGDTNMELIEAMNTFLLYLSTYVDRYDQWLDKDNTKNSLRSRTEAV